MSMKLFYLISFLLLGIGDCFAQLDSIKIPFDRQLFHDKILEEQNEIDKRDGSKDRLFSVSEDESINLLLSDVLFRKTDELRHAVESNTAIPTRNEKVKYLRYLESLLGNFRTAMISRKIDPLEFPTLVENF